MKNMGHIVTTLLKTNVHVAQCLFHFLESIVLNAFSIVTQKCFNENITGMYRVYQCHDRM